MTSPPNTSENNHADAVPPVVGQDTWEAALAQLRAREKAATCELDAITAARRRLPMVELPDYTLDGPDGQIRLVDVFDGRRQLIVYSHMWIPGEEWQCSGCTGFTSQFTRLEAIGVAQPPGEHLQVGAVGPGPQHGAVALRTARHPGTRPNGLEGP